MVKLYLITGYNSWNNKVIKKAFREPSKALDFSLSLTNSKMTILTNVDYIEILNDYLKGA